jgi:hypothetical protein
VSSAFLGLTMVAATPHNSIIQRAITCRSETPSPTAFKASNRRGPAPICVQHRIHGCVRHATATDQARNYYGQLWFVPENLLNRSGTVAPC